MKNKTKMRLGLIIISILMSATAASAQHKWSITPKVGVNIPIVRGLKMDNDDHTGTFRTIDNRIGLQAGVDVNYRLNDKMSVSSGLNYMLNRIKFHDEKPAYAFSASEGYLQMPVMLNFHPVKGLSVKAGIAAAMRLHGSSTFNTETAIHSEKKKTLSTRWLFTLPVGLSYEYRHFVVEALCHIGLNKITHKCEQSGYVDVPLSSIPSRVWSMTECGPVRNGYVSLTLGYRFDL